MSAPTRGAARRALVVTALVVALATGLLAAIAAPASAHASLESSDPATGSTTPVAPDQLVLTYTEGVVIVDDSVMLLDGDGEMVHGVTAVRGASDSIVVADLPELADGPYVVSWHVTSPDGHPIRGALSFAVGSGEALTGSDVTELAGVDDADPVVVVLFALARWLAFAGVLVLAGGTAFVVVLWPDGAQRPEIRRLLRGALLLTALGTLAWIPLAAADLAGKGLGAAFDPDHLDGVATGRVGAAALARLLAGAAVLALGARAAERRSSGALAGLGVAMVVLAASFGASGHATSGRWIALGVPVDALHVAAVAMWIGGLVVLAVDLHRDDGIIDGPLVERWARVAAWSVAVIVLTGAIQTWRRSVVAAVVTDSDWGRALVVKLLLVGGMLVAAIVSRAIVRRHHLDQGLDRQQLRRTVLVEVVLAVGVIGASAVLVRADPTPAGAADVNPSTTTAVEAADPVLIEVPVGEQTVRIEVAPAVAGQNSVRMAVLDAAGDPGVAEEVTASITLPAEDLGPFDLPLVPGTGATWTADVIDLPLAGDWTMTLTVRTSEIDQDTAEVVLPVVPRG